jgi:hypothetical protein
MQRADHVVNARSTCAEGVYGVGTKRDGDVVQQAGPRMGDVEGAEGELEQAAPGKQPCANQSRHLSQLYGGIGRAGDVDQRSVVHAHGREDSRPIGGGIQAVLGASHQQLRQFVVAAADAQSASK